MGVVFLIALLIGIIAASVVGLVVYLRNTKEERDLDKRWRAYREQMYSDCRVMWETASIENQVYGVVISGSIHNHIIGCTNCKYVLSTGPENTKLLAEHRKHMIELERSWKDERRASNAAGLWD